MNVTPTMLPDVLVIEPRVFSDERGFFFESWNERAFHAAGLVQVVLIGGPLRLGESGRQGIQHPESIQARLPLALVDGRPDEQPRCLYRRGRRRDSLIAARRRAMRHYAERARPGTAGARAGIPAMSRRA